MVTEQLNQELSKMDAQRLRITLDALRSIATCSMPATAADALPALISVTETARLAYRLATMDGEVLAQAQAMFAPLAPPAEPAKVEYEVFDNRTRTILPRRHATLKGAHRRADRLDLEYGAVRYSVRRVQKPVIPEGHINLIDGNNEGI